MELPILGPTPNGANGFNVDDDDDVCGADDFLSLDFGSGLRLPRMGVECATGPGAEPPPTRYGSWGLTSDGSGSNAYGLASFSTRNDFVAGFSFLGLGVT